MYCDFNGVVFIIEIVFPSIYRIIGLSFGGAIGILFVVLGCALKEYG